MNRKGHLLIELITSMPLALLSSMAVGATALYLQKMVRTQSLLDTMNKSTVSAVEHLSRVGRLSKHCEKIKNTLDEPGQMVLECQVVFSKAFSPPSFNNVRFAFLPSRAVLSYSTRSGTLEEEPWVNRLNYPYVKSFILCDNEEINSNDITVCALVSANGTGSFSEVPQGFFQFYIRSEGKTGSLRGSFLVRNAINPTGPQYLWGVMK